MAIIKAHKKSLSLSVNLLFFLLFFLYTGARINPRLLYYYKNPELFLLDTDFFKNFLLYPGGVCDYFSRLLLEFYYFGWLGAFIITLCLFFVCLGFKRFLKNFSEIILPDTLFCLPAILILAIYNRYSPISLIGLLFAFIFIHVYIFRTNASFLQKIILFTILSVIMFYLAVYSYWYFAFMCVIWEIVKNRRYFLGWLYLFMEIAVLSIYAKYVLYAHGKESIYYLFPFFYPVGLNIKLTALIVLVSLFAVMILITKSKKYIFIFPVFLIAIFQIWAEPLSNKIFYAYLFFAPLFVGVFNQLYKRWLSVMRPEGKRLLFLGGFIIFAVFIALSFNKEENALLKIKYFSENKDWDGVLKEAKGVLPEFYQRNKPLYQTVFRALSYSGRLPYEQFNYPAYLLLNMPYPRPGSAIFKFVSPSEAADTCFNLGLVNHAELMSCWALELEGDLVSANKQLTMIYILKGNKKAARVVLSRIKKSLIYRKWAQSYLALLDDDDLLLADSDIKLAKSRMIKSDDVKDDGLLIDIAYKYDYEAVFKRLLSENPNNKMAFEYLMSYYLLMGETEKIVENLNRLNDFGYSGIPRNYQEAILMNMLKTGNTIIETKESVISEPLLQKYNYFDQVYRKSNFDKLSTYNALKGKDRDYYYLYYIMLTTGK
ncbi:MAG: DUF6057 family protein [Candidatus Omnitrophota bacterium]|nr:DUF6057 family protein [Candidatus Omnitrophota bacterium]